MTGIEKLPKMRSRELNPQTQNFMKLYNLSKRDAKNLKSALGKIKYLDNISSCREASRKSGLSYGTVRTYRHLLIKTGFIEKKAEYKKIMQTYDTSQDDARMLKAALNYKDTLCNNKLTYNEMAKEADLSKNTISPYRHILIKLGIAKKKDRRNQKTKILAKTYSLPYAHAKFLSNALRYKDLLGRKYLKNSDIAKKLGLSVPTVSTYKWALKKAGY